MPGSALSSRLRAAFRLLRIGAGTVAGYVLFLGGSLVLLPAPRRREAWRNGVRRRWAGWMTRALGIRVRVRGEAPSSPFLLVSNHLSYLDIVLLLALAGGVFVAKAEIGTWPLIGHLTRISGTVLIDRGSKRDLLRVAEQIERRLTAGCGVILFPEGTTGRGDALLPFKPSLLEVAVRSGSPVWSTTIAYRSPPGWPPAEEAICWWRDMELVPHIRDLLRLPRVEATVDFASRPVSGDDRKELAKRLRAEMEERFVPSAPPAPERTWR